MQIRGPPYFSTLLSTPLFASKGAPLFLAPCLQIRGPPYFLPLLGTPLFANKRASLFLAPFGYPLFANKGPRGGPLFFALFGYPLFANKGATLFLAPFGYPPCLQIRGAPYFSTLLGTTPFFSMPSLHIRGPVPDTYCRICLRVLDAWIQRCRRRMYSGSGCRFGHRLGRSQGSGILYHPRFQILGEHVMLFACSLLWLLFLLSLRRTLE